MSTTATMKRKSMGPTAGEHFQPDEQLREYLESLSATELRELASYARKMAIGREEPGRAPGTEGKRRWLIAQYVRGSGPYFYLRSYVAGDLTYTDKGGRQRSGKPRTRYVGRRLPADLAEELGYPAGVTPEESGINVSGTPRTSDGRESSKTEKDSKSSKSSKE